MTKTGRLRRKLYRTAKRWKPETTREEIKASVKRQGWRFLLLCKWVYRYKYMEKRRKKNPDGYSHVVHRHKDGTKWDALSKVDKWMRAKGREY